MAETNDEEFQRLCHAGRDAADALISASPELALQALWRLIDKMPKVEFRRIEVLAQQLLDDELELELRCPYCKKLGSGDGRWACIDLCVRGLENSAEVTEAEFASKEISFWTAEDQDFDTLVFRCEACGRGVRLPEGWSVSWL